MTRKTIFVGIQRQGLQQRLVNDCIRDLIVDVRCAYRDNLPDYAEQCKRGIARIFATRHTVKLNRYGYPTPN